MLSQLSQDDRLKLMKFVCSFAWADFEVRPEERAFISRLIRGLELDREEELAVHRWLDVPPSIEEIDPASVPHAHRRLFLDAAHPLPGLLEAAPFLTVPNLLVMAHVLSAAILLGTAFRATRTHGLPNETDQARERLYALGVVWLLLVSPITWPSTLSLLVIPAVHLVGLLHTAHRPAVQNRPRRRLHGLIGRRQDVA